MPGWTAAGSVWWVLVGPPLRSSEVSKEQISSTEGLPALCLLILAVVTVLNLRGLGEAARAFLLPTAVFIVGVLAIIVIGLIHPLALHTPLPGHAIAAPHPVQAVGCCSCSRRSRPAAAR